MYTPSSLGRAKETSTLGAKLNFNPQIQMKFIVGHVLIYRLLIMELGGLPIEAHSDPDMMGSSLPFSSTAAFSLPVPLIMTDVSPFFIAIETRR